MVKDIIKTSAATVRASNAVKSNFMRRLFNLFSFNTIPLSPYGAYGVAILRIVTELSADVSDMNHHVVIGRIGVRLIPDKLVYALRGINAFLIGCKKKQYSVLKVGKYHFFSICLHHALSCIDLYVSATVYDRAWFSGFCPIDVISAEDGFDTVEKLVVGEGLDQIIVATCGKSDRLIVIVPLGGQKQDRNGIPLTYFLTYGKSIHFGHHNVKDHKVEGLIDQIQDLFSAICLDCFISFAV